VRVAAPPVEGAANAALIAFLAKTLGVPKSSLTIVSGAGARLKLIDIAGCDPLSLARVLGRRPRALPDTSGQDCDHKSHSPAAHDLKIPAPGQRGQVRSVVQKKRDRTGFFTPS
jgi:hypothetical protein